MRIGIVVIISLTVCYFTGCNKEFIQQSENKSISNTNHEMHISERNIHQEVSITEEEVLAILDRWHAVKGAKMHKRYVIKKKGNIWIVRLGPEPKEHFFYIDVDKKEVIKWIPGR